MAPASGGIVYRERHRPLPAQGRRWLVLFLSLFFLAFTPAEAKKREPGPPPPNEGGLIDNVNGYTMDGAGRLQRFTAILIDKQGRVAKLLGSGDKRPEWLDFRLDGKGRTLLPGLIDAHGHVMQLGLHAMQLDLSDTRSLEEAKAKLADYAARNPTLHWIIGSGWNQERWGLGRFPTAADIDSVVSDKPVWLERIDGHAGLANSAAIAEAGVTGATAVPAGGRVEKAGGRPTGLFVDGAMGLVRRVIPPALPIERDAALAKAQDILLRFGITATCDMGTSTEDWLTYRRAADLGRLKLRIVSYALGIEPMLAVAGTGPTPWLYDGRLRMVGVKLFADGALGSRGAWLKAPYADAPGERGLQFLDDAQLRNLMSRGAMDNFQVAIHAIGDAANRQVLDAIDEMVDTYKGDRRWRIEHAQIVDPADIPRFGKNGIVASMQPVHETSDRLMAEARLGPGRLTGAYAWRSMLDAGAHLAFGSDYPVESPDPFAGLAAAISRQGPDGQPEGGWMPEQRLSLPEAFAAFTTGAAYAGFAEDRIGSLQPGHMADFILLDRDIFAASPADIRATQVLETWIGGKRAWIR